ncbi:efflux RND transporter permease subunit [Candidatus Gracilibacteria bacterium]|nr:efflux RND transporter permease subunit [Candidatus Gracilibacteria bacterium]MCF7819259.1 efflux RND transporter permease subunit [Candidatus Gracilibacteria bacterium]
MNNHSSSPETEKPSVPHLGSGWMLFLNKFKVTILFTIFILVYGANAFLNIPREITPTIDIPAATIVTVWPGASPGDVEKLVTNKIEKEIKNLDNVDEYTSFSMSGISVVSVEFDIDTDKSENMQKLREELDKAEKDLPDTIVDEPEMTEISVTDIPIVSLTLSGDFSWSELKSFAEVLEDEFESVPKVKDVSVKGAPKDEVHILIDPIKMQAKGIGLSEVIDTIRQHHRDMPLGQISVAGQKIEVTVRSELEEASEFMAIPIKKVKSSNIRLGDFAVVRREFDKFEVETYFATEKQTEPAILIDVIKSGSKGNVIQMVGEVLGRVESLKQNGNIPFDLNVDVTYNRGDDIRESLNTLTNSGQQTLILIAIVMLIALGWRESLLAALAIPLSLLIAITTLFFMGQTFNGVSLFALVLSVGLLVDNAIIIVEGMSYGIHENKMTPYEAAVYTLHTFRWPIITGTLTTLFAFLPMLLFISGVSGQYVSVIPITVMAGLTGALFVALFLLPALGMKFFQILPPKVHRESRTLKKAQRWYGEKMKAILASKGKLALTLAIALGFFLASVGLVVTGRVPIEVFPSSDQTFFAAKAELPVGTKLEETRKLVDPIEEVLRQYFAPQENGDVFLKNFVFTVGRASDAVSNFDGPGNMPEENVLGITINLTDKEEREMRSFEIVPIIQKELRSVIPSHVEFRFVEEEGGPPTGAPIEVRLMGQDLEHLENMADALKEKIEVFEGTENVRDSRSDPVTQVTWRFDRDILAQFGLTPVRIMEALRASVNGTTVIKLTEGDEEIDVDLRVDWDGTRRWDDPQSLDALERIPIKIPSGEFITLSQVAEAHLSSELSRIEHRNGMRILYVRSDLQQGMTASQFAPQIKKAIEELGKHTGEIIEIGGENEEGNRLIQEMSQAMLAAALLIFLVLVWQFNSFSQPLSILLIVPLSLTGVFIGFGIMGLPISFPTMIGIVSLAGIIVNDAIVLIDQINHRLADGLHAVEAYIDAGKERLQPIFLTSVTTVVGMLPLSLSDEVWGGLGFAIVYGMMLSTVLTLVLIPCFLLMIRRSRQWLGRHLRPVFSRR